MKAPNMNKNSKWRNNSNNDGEEEDYEQKNMVADDMEGLPILG